MVREPIRIANAGPQAEDQAYWPPPPVDPYAPPAPDSRKPRFWGRF